ncbi:hypothetical protein [Arthrobacter sp. H41]|uniref:hypothetical protein n=1 Tax=Arthrobacter sp. H41 TaxID=1312978 RepID=UPI00047A3836|nr:hypothetical protein [Arthrobacter sp. H41]
MGTRTKNVWLKKTVVTAILPFVALSFIGCSTDTAGPEEDVDVEDVVEGEEAPAEPLTEDGAYNGFYDRSFSDDYDSLVGEEVTVSAEVNEIISPVAFTIAGTDDTTVEALLIMHSEELSEVTDGLTVGVSGIVRDAFDLPAVEEDMGIDLDDELYGDWDQMRYIEANSVDTPVDADAG